MNSPGQALLWQMMWRSRWGLLAAGAYLVAAVILSHVLPRDLHIQMGDEEVPAVGWFLGMPAVFVNIMLIAVFSMTEHDMRDSGFTTHMLVLPVSTRTLVAWPTFSGCLTLIGVWLITATLIFRPAGIDAPLWWPGAALAYFLASFQVASWTPFVQRWIQLALLVGVLVMPIVALIVFVRFNIQLSDPAIALLLISVVPVAYLAGVSGVARARRGDPYDWRLWSRFVEWAASRSSRARRPFSSLAAAQLWFECRTHVWMVPLFLGCIFCCVPFVPILDRHNLELGWRLVGILLATPLFVAMLAGSALGNLHDPLSRSDTDAFLLTRPISCMSLFKSKLVAAAIVTVAIWIVLLAYSSLLLVRPGFLESVVQVGRTLPVWKAVGLPLFVLAPLVAMTWKNMIENLWVSLTGRVWVAQAYNFGLVALTFISIGIGLWIYFHPALHPIAIAAVPWLIGLVLGLKVIVAMAILHSLAHSRVIRRATAVGLLGLWMIVVAALCVLARYLFPHQLVPLTSILPGIALLVPFSRLVGAPLALAWNRHR